MRIGQPRSLQSRQLWAASLGLVAFLALAGYALDFAFQSTARSGMRERLQQCGGQLQVETRPGEGFQLRATVPATVLAALTQVPEGVR